MRRSARTIPIPRKPSHLFSGSRCSKISASRMVQYSLNAPPPVAFLDATIRLPLQVSKAILLRHRKRGFDLFVQVPLVVFECESIIPLLLNNLLGNLDLRSHSINGHNTPFES